VKFNGVVVGWEAVVVVLGLWVCIIGRR